MRNYILGLILILTLCIALALAAENPVQYVDGHCQSSLSTVAPTGEAYLAITNSATGLTVVHKFGPDDFDDENKIVLNADVINQDRLIVIPPHNW